MNIFQYSLERTNRITTILLTCIVVFVFTAGSFGLGTSIASAQESTQPSQVDCGGFGYISNLGTCTFLPAVKFITRIVFDITGWFANATGEALDIALKYTLTTSNYKLSGITEGWKIFRDLTNMVFIFILLYIGAMTVLQLFGAQTKRMLTALIIVALLINFSYFLTGFVIDVGNVTAGFLYENLTPTIQVPDGAGGSTPQKYTLGNTFKTGLKITTLLDENGLQNRGISDDKLILIYLLGSVVLLIAGFIFLAIAILFFLRTVVLMFVLMLSPLAFAALILPQTKKYWDMWLEKLIGNTFVAPVFLLTISVVVLLINSDAIFTAAATAGNGGQLKPDDQTLLAALNFRVEGYSLASHVQIVLNYILIVGLLVASLTITQKMAGGIASTSTKWAGKILRGAGGAATIASRPLRPLGQYVHGRIAGAAEKIEEGKPGTKRQKFLDNTLFVGRALRRGFQQTRASYTGEVYKRQKDFETLRSAEIDRRIKSASGHDFLALISEKAKRNDLDEVNVQDLDKAKRLMRQRGMGTRPYRANRPDVGTTEAEVIANVMTQNDEDISKMHRIRSISLENDDKTTKWGDERVAQERRGWLQKAWFERLEGRAVMALLRGGGLNTTGYLQYGAEQVGSNLGDPQLLQKMGQRLREINHMRQTGRTINNRETAEAQKYYNEAQTKEMHGLIERTESTIRELESVAAQRIAGVATGIVRNPENEAPQTGGGEGGQQMQRDMSADEARQRLQNQRERGPRRRA